MQFWCNKLVKEKSLIFAELFQGPLE